MNAFRWLQSALLSVILVAPAVMCVGCGGGTQKGADVPVDPNAAAAPKTDESMQPLTK
jgi:hypothetical protein